MGSDKSEELWIAAAMRFAMTLQDHSDRADESAEKKNKAMLKTTIKRIIKDCQDLEKKL